MSEFSQHRYVDTLPKSEKALRLVWQVVWVLLFRPTPRWAMHGWRRGLLRLFGAKVGQGCKVDPSCTIWAPWKLSLGDFVAIGPDVDCYTMDKIKIGSKTTVSQRSFLCTGSHDTRDLRRPLMTQPIEIGEHAWVAAEAMVMPGVHIGDGAIVGARSLVTRDLPAWTICSGHPCVVRRPRVLNDADNKSNSVEARN